LPEIRGAIGCAVKQAAGEPLFQTNLTLQHVSQRPEALSKMQRLSSAVAVQDGGRRVPLQIFRAALRDPAPRNDFRATQNPQNEAANGIGPTGNALRQAGERKQQGHDAFQHVPFCLYLRIPFHCRLLLDTQKLWKGRRRV
jgi:hypothetical protein